MNYTETLVPKEQKMAHADGMNYLTNDSKVKISVSPKETWKLHLEDSSITSNFIPSTTRAEKTAPFSGIEKHLETSNYVNLVAHVNKISQLSSGSEGTSCLSDNSRQLKNHRKRDHLSTSNSEGPTNSKNAVDCNFGTGLTGPLKKRRMFPSGNMKPQIYDDALDVSEHHTHGRKEGDISNSTESSHTSFIKNKSPEHRLKKKKVGPIKQDLLDMSPTFLDRAKQLLKDTRSKTDNLNADSEMIKSCDQPNIFESRSSTDSILKMKPKNILRKKVSRARGKNPFASLMATCNNIDRITEVENKTGKNSSGSVSSISPASVNVRPNFKRAHLEHCMYDSLVDNPIVGDSVHNMQPNVNNPCTSEQRSKDISTDTDVLKAPAYPKIVRKINNEQLQHNFFESAENDEQNVQQQHSNIALSESYAQNRLAANTNDSTDISATKLLVAKFLTKQFCSKPAHTFNLSGMQGHSHNNRSSEGGRQTSYGDQNSSINKLSERNFRRSVVQTSKYNRPILPESERSTESPSDSPTASKFKPKITSSRVDLAQDEIPELHPPNLVALQQKLASNRWNLTRKEKEIDQSDNHIVCQPTSTDCESDETNYKKRKKYYNNVCDNSVPSSDLTFDPDNVPHSTMVKSSSKKRHPPCAMDKTQVESKARRSLAQSFLGLAHISTDSGEKISSEPENAGIINKIYTLNGRESENEPAIENERNGNRMKYSELQTNECRSNIVDKDSNFPNNISVPENLYVVSDHEPVTESIPKNVLKVLRSVCSTSKPSASDNDVSQVFRHVSQKTKNLGKSSSVNSQEEFINADSKNEKKRQGSNKSVHGEPENFSENIVFNEIMKAKSKGCDTKCSVSLPCMENVSSYPTAKTHEKSYRHNEIEQISQLDTSAQKICNSEVEELNLRKSDKVSLRADRSRSSDCSRVSNLSTKLSEIDVLTSKNGSNLRNSSKNTGASKENKFDYAGAPNCNEALCTPKRTPKLRERSSPPLSESRVNKTYHKENLYVDIKNSSKARRKKSNGNSVISHVSNAKIVHSDVSGFSNANNDERFDDYLKDSICRNRPTENGGGSYTDTQLQMTVGDDANGGGGETSVIIGEMRELSPPFLSESRVNTSFQKENFSLNTGNSRKVKSKESNKNSVFSSRSNVKIVHSDSSGLSIVNNGGRPYDDCLNERRSCTDNQPQPIVCNDANDTERERPVVIREPPKESRRITHQKKLETQRKPRAHAGVLIDGEEYRRPKLIKPKPWINNRFYKFILPNFDRKYGLSGNVKCEEFVKLLCSEVTACIRNRKNWDEHVYSVEKLLSKYLSINTYAEYLIFGEKYLPDEFVFKVGLTYEKHYRKK